MIKKEQNFFAYEILGSFGRGILLEGIVLMIQLIIEAFIMGSG